MKLVVVEGYVSELVRKEFGDFCRDLRSYGVLSDDTIFKSKDEDEQFGIPLYMQITLHYDSSPEHNVKVTLPGHYERFVEVSDINYEQTRCSVILIATEMVLA